MWTIAAILSWRAKGKFPFWQNEYEIRKNYQFEWRGIHAELSWRNNAMLNSFRKFLLTHIKYSHEITKCKSFIAIFYLHFAGFIMQFNINYNFGKISSKTILVVSWLIEHRCSFQLWKRVCLVLVARKYCQCHLMLWNREVSGPLMYSTISAQCTQNQTNRFLALTALLIYLNMSGLFQNHKPDFCFLNSINFLIITQFI